MKLSQGSENLNLLYYIGVSMTMVHHFGFKILFLEYLYKKLILYLICKAFF